MIPETPGYTAGRNFLLFTIYFSNLLLSKLFQNIFFKFGILLRLVKTRNNWLDPTVSCVIWAVWSFVPEISYKRQGFWKIDKNNFGLTNLVSKT